MNTIVFEQFGDPRDVLHVRETPIPEPGRGQVRVRMIASPINPSDLLVVRGQYGRLPPLPATPGFEGVGVIEATGGGFLGRLRMGKRVAVLNGNGGTWQERVVIPARQAVPVPASVPDEQAAGFFVNPASTLIMIQDTLKVPRGEWLLQTAAGSALGKLAIRLGKHFGFRTINVVRRQEQGEELLRLGGDAVICTPEESIPEKVRQITQGRGVLYALDAVGGVTGSDVLKALAYGGRLVVYGTLSGAPIAIDPRILMVNHIRVEGFWLSDWTRNRNPLIMLRLFRRISRLLAAGVLHTDIGQAFPLDEIKTAVQQAETPGRNGKILLRM